MHRLFIALDLPEVVKDLLRQVTPHLPGVRPVPMDQLHLTLRFVGETDEASFRLIRSVLEQVKLPPFDLALKGVGHFPPRGEPKVFWAGLEESAPLLQLYRMVEQSLQAVAVPPEGRRFSPHITLARLKSAPVQGILQQERDHAGFRSDPFPVAEFWLYSSVLTRDGAVHTREARYPLAGSPSIRS